MIMKEIDVPNTVDDFEDGERVCYIDPETLMTTLATVHDDPKQRKWMLIKDDGVRIGVRTKQYPGELTQQLLFSDLDKALDVESLSVGMAVSRKVSVIDGFVARFHAFVEEVVPGKKIVLSYHDPNKNPWRHEFIEGKDGKTLEYHLAGWDIEE